MTDATRFTPDPADVAFLAMMDKILTAKTAPALIALAGEIRALFAGRRPTEDYTETWQAQWNAVTDGAPVPSGVWA